MNKPTKTAVDRFRSAATLAALALSLTAATSARAAFTFDGVSAGDADSNSVLFWTRGVDTNAPANTSINLQICSDTNFVSGVTVLSTNTAASNDYTAKIDVTGLNPASVYYYRWVETNSGATSIVGKIKTAPLATAQVALHFGFSGDMDGLIRPYAIASQVPADNLDFYYNCGDTIYETASAVKGNIGLSYTNSVAVHNSGASASLNGIPDAGTNGSYASQAQLFADYTRKYHEQFLPVNTGGQNGLQSFYAGQGNYTCYDNHELGNRQYINGGAPAGGSVGGTNGSNMLTGRGVDARYNGTGNVGLTNDAADVSGVVGSNGFMNKSTGFQTLQQAYLAYQPVADRGTISAPSDPRTDGTKQLYFSQRWGRNAIFFSLDDRTYRDIRIKTADGSDDDTGVRADNTNRAYLGKTQLAWLESNLLAAQKAGVIWKFIGLSNPSDQIGPIPTTTNAAAKVAGNLPGVTATTMGTFSGNAANYAPVSSDGGKAYMGGYRAERNALLKFIADNQIVNVVFMATDDHQNRINEVLYSTNGQTGVQSTYTKVPYCFSIICGPLGATGPDLFLNHDFASVKGAADLIYNAQVSNGIEGIGLMGYPGLTNVMRDSNNTLISETTPQAVDFYSPDTFNYNTLDVSADGSTLTVTSKGIKSTAQNSAAEYSASTNPAHTIFSFQVKAAAPSKLSQIDHIIVVYQENWSFDGLYGSFPGANGIANASPTSLNQLDRVSGQALSSLSSNYNDADPSVTAPFGPIPLPLLSTNFSTVKSALDPHFPSNLNTLLPYLASSYINATNETSDIVHRYWTEQFQINHGSNNAFMTWSDNPGLVMSHFDASSMPEGLLAKQYTMCDNFFHSAFGGSFLNHQFLIAAAAPVYYNMPTNNQGALTLLNGSGRFVTNSTGSNAGKFIRDGSITPVAGDILTGLTINGVTNQTVTVASNNAVGSDVVAFDGSHFDKHYVVNTSFSVNLPTSGSPTAVSLIPSQNDSNPSDSTRPYIPTIGDLLDNAGVSWKWYSGGWDRALAVSPANPTHYGTTAADPALTTNPTLAANYPMSLFQWHHQCFAFFDNYAPFVSTNFYATNQTTGGLNPYSAARLQDLDAHFYSDVSNNTLPAVSFVKFMGPDNEHPGYASVLQGQQAVANLVAAVQANTNLWAHTAIIVTYDEHGGRFDHVKPPTRDIWGPGVRVPCIVISPLARKGFVDHTQYDTTSILSTIEKVFGLGSLNSRDAVAPTLAGIFTDNQVTLGGFTYNRSTGTLNQTITVKNNSGIAMVGPICVALDGLSSNTTLKNKNGNTVNSSPTGSPYIKVSNSTLAAGASVTITLQFANPASGAVTYTPRVITGSYNP